MSGRFDVRTSNLRCSLCRAARPPFAVLGRGWGPFCIQTPRCLAEKMKNWTSKIKLRAIRRMGIYGCVYTVPDIKNPGTFADAGASYLHLYQEELGAIYIIGIWG